MKLKFIVEHSSSTYYYHTTHHVSIPNELLPEEVNEAIKEGKEVEIELDEEIEL